MNNLPIFRKIELLKKNNNSLTNIKYENASMLITGNCLIIIEQNSELNSTDGTIFNLLDIKSYRTY